MSAQQFKQVLVGMLEKKVQDHASALINQDMDEKMTAKIRSEIRGVAYAIEQANKLYQQMFDLNVMADSAPAKPPASKDAPYSGNSNAA